MPGRLAILLALGALVAGPPAAARAAAPYADDVLASPSLAGYWAFNEPAGPVTADLRTTGAGVHTGGVHPGAPALVGRGRSASYDGHRAATVVANSRRLNPTRALTIEAWVAPRAVRHAATLAGKSGQYALGFDRLGRAVLRLWSGAVQGRLAGPPGSVARGRVTFVAATFAGRRARLYVDGRPVAHLAVDAPLDKTAHPLVLGGGLDGRLDDVALYASALAPGTLAARAAAGRRAACPSEPVGGGLAAGRRPACLRPYFAGRAVGHPGRAGRARGPGSPGVG